MYLADFLIAHAVPDSAIRSASAAALALDTSDVGVWRRGQVLDRTTTAIVQTSAIDGDFPYQMSVTVGGDIAKPDLQEKLLDIARILARELSTIVVTDEVGLILHSTTTSCWSLQMAPRRSCRPTSMQWRMTRSCSCLNRDPGMRRDDQPNAR